MKQAFVWLLALALLAGCTGAAPRSPSPTPSVMGEAAPAGTVQEVRLVTHDSFSMDEAVLAEWEQSHNARLVIVPLGDAGALVNQSILSAGNPLGDVLFGVDNTFLARALDADIFEPYAPAALAQVDDTLELDAEHRVVPVDFGDVCLNYDKVYFETQGLAPPTTLEDLVKPEYRDLTVVENPAASSPGLAFLLATVEHFGADGWGPYWAALRDNGVLVAAGWTEAYFTEFSAGGGEGARPIVVSYASSPAASDGTTASVLADGSCFRQIEFAGVLRNAQAPDLARALVDFLLSPPFQSQVPEQMYVYPVLAGTALPEAFQQHAQPPVNPVTTDPAFIEANRDRLIEEWSDTVLQ